MEQTTVTYSLTSTPALAAALRTMDCTRFTPVLGDLNRVNGLVQMYQNPGGADEAALAAQVASQVAERLRRLATAYGEWEVFDAPAYFDLSNEQSAALVRIVERVSTVHVVFYTDLLLPSFRAAATFWAESFVPGYRALRQEPELVKSSHHRLVPTMHERWSRLLAVLHNTRALLADDVGFWATNGVQEERERWRRWWEAAPCSGLDPLLTPDLAAIPTLTLNFDFALPAHRQAGRLRRLRTNRDRRRRARGRNSQLNTGITR